MKGNESGKMHNKTLWSLGSLYWCLGSHSVFIQYSICFFPCFPCSICPWAGKFTQMLRKDKLQIRSDIWCHVLWLGPQHYACVFRSGVPRSSAPVNFSTLIDNIILTNSLDMNNNGQGRSAENEHFILLNSVCVCVTGSRWRAVLLDTPCILAPRIAPPATLFIHHWTSFPSAQCLSHSKTQVPKLWSTIYF